MQLSAIAKLAISATPTWVSVESQLLSVGPEFSRNSGSDDIYAPEHLEETTTAFSAARE